MSNKLSRLSIVCIVLFAFPGLAFNQQPPSPPVARTTKLVPPAHGKIPVAFVIGRGAETIDFVGPMEVFTFTYFPSRGGSMEDMQAFQPYIVSDSTKPVRVTGGMQIIPDYIFADANDKQLVGTADLLNRDDRDLFIDPIAFNGQDLHFEIRLGKSAFDGKLNAQGTTIEGTWKQLGEYVPLVLKRVAN